MYEKDWKNFKEGNKKSNKQFNESKNGQLKLAVWFYGEDQVNVTPT